MLVITKQERLGNRTMRIDLLEELKGVRNELLQMGDEFYFEIIIRLSKVIALVEDEYNNGDLFK